MRHGKKITHLGRTSGHRKAMLSNMASSLILEKRISTTVAKAKALRKYVEPLLTRAKLDSTHSRRMVFSYLKNKESLKELFGGVAEKIAARPGGYTRILKIGTRPGDNSEMAIIELVDFNETYVKEGKTAGAAKRTRRSKKGTKAEGTVEAKEASSETKIESSEENKESKSGSKDKNKE